MSDYICDDGIDPVELLKEIDAMSEEEKQKYIEEYERN